MRLRRTLAAALAVMFALVATGCAEDPEPKFAAPTTASPNGEPAETESPDPEGESPEEFIRRWQAAGDEMQVTGETEEFRKLSRGCEACMGLIRSVERVYATGGSVAFDGSVVSLLKMVADDPPTYNMDLKTPETRVLDADGRTTQSFPAGTGRYVVTLAPKADGWRVAHYARR